MTRERWANLIYVRDFNIFGWLLLVDGNYAFLSSRAGFLLLILWLSISWWLVIVSSRNPNQYQLGRFQGTRPRDKTNPSHNTVGSPLP